MRFERFLSAQVIYITNGSIHAGHAVSAQIRHKNEKTISRIANGETKPNVTTAALICFGLKVSPIISDKLMEVFGCKISNSMKSNEQWINEALHVKYPEPIWAVQEYLAQYGVTLE